MLGDQDRNTLISINNMGLLLTDQGKLAEAEPYYREAAEWFERQLGAADWQTGNARRVLGRTIAGLRRFPEAQEQLLQAEETLRHAQGAPPSAYGSVLEALVELYEAWHAEDPQAGNDARAGEWRAKLELWRTSTQPPSVAPTLGTPAGP